MTLSASRRSAKPSAARPRNILHGLLPVILAGLSPSSLPTPAWASPPFLKVAEISPFAGALTDREVISPKSVLFHPVLPKFYINALEAGKTLVYDAATLTKTATIAHSAGNDFGKPVEGWFTHGGRYLWVTYYRMNRDTHATGPSMFVQIDTETDRIVHSFPTGNIPKAISADAASSQLAVTLWGENKVELYDIRDPLAVRRIGTVEIGPPPAVRPGSNRDRTCGLCLRGTVFLPGTDYLVVARMGGGGLAVVDVKTLRLVKVITQVPPTPRHLVVHGDSLYISSNVSGTVSRIGLRNLVAHIEQNSPLTVAASHVGGGARTIKVADDKIYVALHDSKMIARMNLDLTGVEYAGAAPYPVGLDVKGDLLLVSSQGMNGLGGHRVGVYSLSGAPGPSQKAFAPPAAPPVQPPAAPQWPEPAASAAAVRIAPVPAPAPAPGRVPAPASVTTAGSPPAGEAYFIHLESYRDRVHAETAVRALMKTPFGANVFSIMGVTDPKSGQSWQRVVIQGYPTAAAAEAVCRPFRAAGRYCQPMRR
ncbi:SPOR domain-containing protein [Azospirillum doebereinerae]|uniref:SPOR domain-containing protein n=1 Tax=Azospirillum doebereinerae TaxID=92933 RepID=A0A433J5E3_9PROT|nr:SPOR domain-containing protein [Azospirillum doebereinerae]RUQ67767.1 hypothetical protein EJ913_19005 [Azospirillum doebereinerae]